MEPEPTNGLSDDQLADLARLADGTLPADRRAEVEARVAASPQLSSIVERQGVALDALRGTADTGAPARLRAQVDRRRGAGRAAGGGRRRVVLGGAIAAAASVALALILVLPGAFSGGPSVADAAALAEKPPTQAAPGGVPGTPQLLRAEVDDVPFPNYAAKFGWKPVGARQDDPSGRDATTVYYEKGGRDDRVHDRLRRRARPAVGRALDHARRRRVPQRSATTAERSSRGSATATRACCPARRCGPRSSSCSPTGEARARSPSRPCDAAEGGYIPGV